MNIGRSDGGLPPDEVVEDRDAILGASEDAVRRFHDPSPGAMGPHRAGRRVMEPADGVLAGGEGAASRSSTTWFAAGRRRSARLAIDPRHGWNRAPSRASRRARPGASRS